MLLILLSKATLVIVSCSSFWTLKNWEPDRVERLSPAPQKNSEQLRRAFVMVSAMDFELYVYVTINSYACAPQYSNNSTSMLT